MISSVSGRYSSNLVPSLTQRDLVGDTRTTASQVADVGVEPQLQDPLAELERILASLAQQLQRVGAAAGTDLGSSSGAPRIEGGGGGGGMTAADTGGGYGGGTGATALTPYSLGGMADGSDLLAGIEVSDPRLAEALQQIASHPDGAKLIAAAKANGLTSLSVNPSLNPDGGAGVEGLTRWGGGGPTSIEISNPDSASLIHTLAHELGHAATTADGNSQMEEQIVDALGERIAQDLTGVASGFDLDESAYTHLPGDNGILNNLLSLGIRV